jgi:hypothetical protein
VASAYVSLCEELDRELAPRPPRRCARAASKRAPRSTAPISTARPRRWRGGGGAIDASAGYETQVARATFEAPSRSRRLRPALIRILADPIRRAPRARSRRRPLRRRASPRHSLLFAAAGSLGYVWWSDPEQLQFIARYLPLPPDPELVEAQTGAEYLRRRVAEERRDIQRRARSRDERSRACPDRSNAAEGWPAEVRAPPPGAWSRRRRVPPSPSAASS